jgi:hypothetical protein
MKYCHLLILPLFFATIAKGQAKYSVHAGISHHNSNQIGEVLFYEATPTFSPRMGFTIGGQINLPLSKRVIYQSGLFYQGKATRYQIMPSTDYSLNRSLRIHYLSLNQNALYRFWGNKQRGLYAGAGLYGAIAMGGLFNDEVITNMGTTNMGGSMKFEAGTNAYYRIFDAGGNLLLMGQHKKWQATLQLSHSVAPYIKPEKIRFTSLFFMLGYEL